MYTVIGRYTTIPIRKFIFLAGRNMLFRSCRTARIILIFSRKIPKFIKGFGNFMLKIPKNIYFKIISNWLDKGIKHEERDYREKFNAN